MDEDFYETEEYEKNMITNLKCLKKVKKNQRKENTNSAAGSGQRDGSKCPFWEILKQICLSKRIPKEKQRTKTIKGNRDEIRKLFWG